MTKQQAYAYLSEAALMNPGPWVGHSENVALAAESIAKQTGMDSDLAYTMGLLHDIGRREGVYKLRHVIDGYSFLLSEGYPDHARICITHSYTVKDIDNFGDYDDMTAEERQDTETYDR
jgi:putative nucleotidyltransferase with HDIG domain